MKYSLLAICSMLILLSCNKDESDKADTRQSNTELLVNKKWQLVAISAKLKNGTVIPDDYSSLEAYEKDDYIVFKQDLTYSINDNKLKRPGSTTDIIDYGTWALTNGDQYLSMQSTVPQVPGSELTYFPTKILELKESSMKWESTDTQEGTVIWTNYITIP